MTVLDQFSCVRPLLWENDDPDFEYSIGGSGFLARYNGRHYLITARHCLRNRDKDSLRIEIRPRSRVFNAIKALHVAEGKEHWKDICLFEFDEKLDLADDLSSRDFADFDYFMQFEPRLRLTATYGFRGYPTEFNSPDYEAKGLRNKSITLDGHWNGHFIKPNCGVIRISETFGLEDLDGISGAPVFQFVRQRGGYVSYFGGMVIESSGFLRVVRFISPAVVFSALRTLAKR